MASEAALTNPLGSLTHPGLKLSGTTVTTALTLGCLSADTFSTTPQISSLFLATSTATCRDGGSAIWTCLLSSVGDSTLMKLSRDSSSCTPNSIVLFLISSPSTHLISS
ncbi:hypothetical protein UPYG_G00187960 [Umbra pygmaea]|uniref:Uncharacterized protein n=1 Tax=Umbra pygmaea TaxID=75934 RepID=A0ABD0WS64_UMBPY